VLEKNRNEITEEEVRQVRIASQVLIPMNKAVTHQNFFLYYYLDIKYISFFLKPIKLLSLILILISLFDAFPAKI